MAEEGDQIELKDAAKRPETVLSVYYDPTPVGLVRAKAAKPEDSAHSYYNKEAAELAEMDNAYGYEIVRDNGDESVEANGHTMTQRAPIPSRTPAAVTQDTESQKDDPRAARRCVRPVWITVAACTIVLLAVVFALLFGLKVIRVDAAIEVDKENVSSGAVSTHPSFTNPLVAATTTHRPSSVQGNLNQYQANGCPIVVTRSEWGARPAKAINNLPEKPVYFFIHHAATQQASTIEEGKKVIRGVQDFHMDDRGWDDIGYSFPIDDNGVVYEGRGWDRIGAHTRGWNSVGLGLSVMGNFNDVTPTEATLDGIRKMIECTVRSGRLDAGYTLLGHCDRVQTECPGDKLYAIIQTWPHYDKPRSK